MKASELMQSHCQDRKGEPVLAESRLEDLLAAVDGWTVAEDGKSIGKAFKFKDFDEAMAFASAVVKMANAQNHHPELAIGYGHCTVQWSTHVIGGLSVNDFICAAHVDAMTRPASGADQPAGEAN